MINSKFNVGDEVFVKATVCEILVDANGIKYTLDIREREADDIRYSVTARVKEEDIFQSPYPAEGNAHAKPACADYPLSFDATRMKLYHDQDDLK